MLRPSKPTLCYVTDRKSVPGGEKELLHIVELAAAARVDWIQIREKDLPAVQLAALTREALRLAARNPAGGPRILVNDRLDIAVAVRAGGVHLGETSLPTDEVVRWLRSPDGTAVAGADFFVGVSCHSLASAREAERAGANYVFFGPVFATPSKAAYGPPQGTEQLAEVCRAVKVPVVAIGGITEENAGACLAAGAAGIAAIRLFQNARAFSTVVAALRAVSPPRAARRPRA